MQEFLLIHHVFHCLVSNQPRRQPSSIPVLQAGSKRPVRGQPQADGDTFDRTAVLAPSLPHRQSLGQSLLRASNCLAQKQDQIPCPRVSDSAKHLVKGLKYIQIPQ